MNRELDERPDPGAEDPDPRTTMIAGGCLYTALLTASVIWLAVRDRIELLHTAALGRHGAPLAAAAGLTVGVAGYAVFALLLQRRAAVVAVTAQVRRMLAGVAEAPILATVLFGAVSEEVFFRLAVQDQFGLVGSVATYTFVATGALGLRWIPLAALHATVLGGLMALGFGLLSTTTANAVMNYLVLRRMLLS